MDKATGGFGVSSANPEESIREAYGTFQKIWGVVGAWVMLIWIIPIFLINMIIWFFILLWAIPQSLWNAKFAPVLLIIGATGLLLLQANQDAIVELSNVTTSCLDEIYAVFGKGIWDDMVRCLFPICTFVNYFVGVLKFTTRTVVDEYRCFWSCDLDVCPCDTCNGGGQCECPKCEAGAPPECVCDNDAVGCPAAGGFAGFTDCCGCFITAFEDLLFLSGFTIPEVIQIVTDLIDYFDIVPANPALVSDFVANFPQPGDVNWLWPGTRGISVVGGQSMASGFHPGRHIRASAKASGPVLLERYANHSACALNADGGLGKRCIPQNILDIMTPGTDGYSTLIFEIICQEFLGPFIELFMEVVLWLFNFIATFFELGWENVMDFLDKPSSMFQDMVEQLFQLFTHEFLCFLLNWSGALSACCDQLDFSGPVEFILSLLLDNCLGIPREVLDCLLSVDNFVNCILDVIDGGSSVVGAASTTGSAAAASATTAAAAAVGILRITNVPSQKPRQGGGAFVQPDMKHASRQGGGMVIQQTQQQVPPIKTSGTTVTGSAIVEHISDAHSTQRGLKSLSKNAGESGGVMQGIKNFIGLGNTNDANMQHTTPRHGQATGGGSGFAPAGSIAAMKLHPRKRFVENILKNSAGNTKSRMTPASKMEHLTKIYNNRGLKAFHERMLGMTMDVAYPDLMEEVRDTRYTSARGTNGEKPTWRSRSQGIFSERKNGYSVFYGLGSLTESGVRSIVDFAGQRTYDHIESYVANVGVGEPSYFNSPTYSNVSIKLFRAHADKMARTNPMSAYDRDRHETRLQEEERKLLENSFRDQKRFGQLDPWMQLTHGQKALRYTSVWTNALKEMMFFPRWNDEKYDFDVPSAQDLRTEFDGRKIGSAIVRSVTHWLSFLRQDNQKRTAEMEETINERPPMIIHLEVTLKMMAWRFTAPWALERLREQIAAKGPRWNTVARSIIDPAIRSRNLDTAEREKRKKAFERGDPGSRFQMPEINMGLVLRWILEKASYRTASVHHRQQIADALRVDNRTRYIELKRYEEEMKNPITNVIEHIHRKAATGDISKYNDTTRESYYAEHHVKFRKNIDPEVSMKNMEERFGRQFDRLVYNGGLESSSWSYWVYGPGKDLKQSARTVSPEVVEFFREHHQRVAGATSTDQIFQEYRTTATRIPQLAAVGSLILPLIKNWRYIAGISVPVLTSPYAQNVYKMYIDFFERQIGDIISEPIADLVNSPGFLLQFSEDFGITTLETIDYIIAEIIRILLCLMPQIVLQTLTSYLSLFAMLIPYVGTVITTILAYTQTMGAFFLPLIAVCPPEVQIGEQNALTYMFDTLDCSSEISCSTANDCPGKAPCRCPPATTQWTSLFWEFNGDFNQDCPAMSGYCLCFWEFPCDFVFPELHLNDFFDQDCSVFGYDTDASIVPWYPNNPYIFGSFSNFMDYIWKWVSSGIEWLRFITRTIVRGYEPYFSTSMFVFFAAFGVGFAVTFGKPLWIFGVVILMFTIAFGSPLLTDFVGSALIPSIEQIGDTFSFLEPITDWLLEFLRWDNFTNMDPIGSPDPSEFTCFLLNSGTGLMSLGVFVFAVLIINVLIARGILADLWLLFIYFLLLVPRTVWRVLEFMIFISEQMDEENAQGAEGEEGGYSESAYHGGVVKRSGYSSSGYSAADNRVEYGGEQDVEFGDVRQDEGYEPLPVDPFYSRYMVSEDNEDGDLQNINLSLLVSDIPVHTARIGKRITDYHKKSMDWREWKIDTRHLPEMPKFIKNRMPTLSPTAQSFADMLIHRQPSKRTTRTTRPPKRKIQRKLRFGRGLFGAGHRKTK